MTIILQGTEEGAWHGGYTCHPSAQKAKTRESCLYNKIMSGKQGSHRDSCSVFMVEDAGLSIRKPFINTSKIT